MLQYICENPVLILSVVSILITSYFPGFLNKKK